jgi:hypothetical protein
MQQRSSIGYNGLTTSTVAGRRLMAMGAPTDGSPQFLQDGEQSGSSREGAPVLCLRHHETLSPLPSSSTPPR